MVCDLVGEAAVPERRQPLTPIPRYLRPNNPYLTRELNRRNDRHAGVPTLTLDYDLARSVYQPEETIAVSDVEDSPADFSECIAHRRLVARGDDLA